MEFRLHHIVHIYHVFLENDEKENCAQLIEEEFYKMFDKNLWMMSMIAMLLVWILLIHDVNDMQSYKLGDAIFDEDDIFSPPSFDENIYYDESMPPIYDDYIDESGF